MSEVAAPTRPRPFRLRIAAFITLVLALFAAVPSGAVLFLGFGTAVSNTARLLEARGLLFRDLMVTRTRDFLAPAEALPGFVAQRLEREELDADDPGAVAEALRYAIGAAPQLASVAFWSEAGWRATAYRDTDGELSVEEADWRGDPVIAAAVADARARGSAAHWGRPLFIPAGGMTVLTFVRPVFLEEQRAGSVVAAVRLDTFSRFTDELVGEARRQFGAEMFVLFGHDYVIAHPRLVRPDGLLTARRPLPLVGEVDDPVLAAIWRPEGREPLRFSDRPGHALEVAGQDHAFFYERLPLPSEAEWLVGGHLPIGADGDEIPRLVAAGVVAVVAVLLAVLAAVVLGRTLSRPAAALAEASRAVGRLDLDEVETLPGSRLVEVDEAARAFNGMVGALRLFVRYAPRGVVRALLRHGDAGAPASERREVTVMFTDITGFTATAERMSAEACAAFLNTHLALVIGRVEAEGGTVDKLMGDGVMAFWNAPEPQPDHALRAARAALAIRAELARSNRDGAGAPGREGPSPEPVRLRIGIHTGPAIVGNVGAPSRLSYTVVGDTVNVASRVEKAGKELLPAAEAAVLISGATAAALAGRLPLVPLGPHHLPGREASIDLFTAPPEAEAA